MPDNVKYSEKILNRLNNMIKTGELPLVKKEKNSVTVTYDRIYSEKKGKISTAFFYKISEEAKPLFGNANKTHVVINHESDIDYKYYHEIFIPREIVAIACGFKDYKDLQNLSQTLPSDEKDRIDYMIHNLIPISAEEYNEI